MKQILSLLLSAALVLTGCGGAGNASGPSKPGAGGRTLAEPVYPEFPVYPDIPGEGQDWEPYYEQMDAYCQAIAEIRAEALTAPMPDSLNAFAASSAALALENTRGENAVYSPVSLWSALAMLAQCAGGDSRIQVLEALGAESVEELQNQVSQVWRRLYTDDGAHALLLSNSIWLDSRREGAYVQSTLDALAQSYFAGAYAVPMGTQEADGAVADWVSRQTNGLIGSDAPVVRTGEDTLALLVSSLYYRAGWTKAFQPHLTKPDRFTDSRGQAAQVDFMHRTESGSWIKGDGYQAAALDNELGEMVFVLPDEGTSPEELLRIPDFLSRLDLRGEDSRFSEIQWSVPKFDVDSSLDLADTLKGLGVTDLLDPDAADLSALTSLSACLSQAKQLARVKVDEEGVEAAAVTILMINETALLVEDPEICVMELNRPFLFVIRNEGVPLFVGVVNQI